MRMNQQYSHKQNGFTARQKSTKNSENHGQSRHHSQQQQQISSTSSSVFKPVAILKRGDPSGTTIINKNESSTKENISASSQQQVRIQQDQTAKPTVDKQVIIQKLPVPVTLSSTKTSVNDSPTITTPVPPATPITTTNSVSTPSPNSTVAPVLASRPSNGPINLTRTTSALSPPVLTQAQHDQHMQSINARLLSTSMTMKSSLKLIDESLTWCENGQLNNYLQDSDGFVVIGAIGREKVGKSTLLSLLGGNQFIDEDRLMMFPAASSNSHKVTNGIDIYITSEQTILLDTQPLLSSQLHQRQILQASNDYNRSQQQQQVTPALHYWQQQIDPRSMFIDNILELQALEIIAFILAVCHVVLIVEDQFADPYLYRLLQLADILRPILKRNSNEIIKPHSPHIVFVLNKCNNYISPQERLLIKRSLAQMMMDTQFRIYSSLKQTNKIKIQTNLKHIVSDLKQQELNENLLIKLLQQTKLADDDQDETSKVMDFKEFNLNNENDEDLDEKQINYEHVNAIFIPRRDFRDSHSLHWQSRFLGFSNADSIVRQLRQQLLAIDRPHIEQCQTQRAWLMYASRIWELIAKSNQWADFSRLLT